MYTQLVKNKLISDFNSYGSIQVLSKKIKPEWYIKTE